MPCNVLSFELHQEIRHTEEGTRYTQVQVLPLVDGHPVDQCGGVFDALEILLTGASDAELDIYTCTCGIAGCAGIHEECSITTTQDVVTWNFPPDTFTKRFAAGAPLSPSFSKPQYEEALHQLIKAVEDIRTVSQMPVAFGPNDYVDDRDLIGSLQEHLVECRHSRAKWEAERIICARLRQESGEECEEAVCCAVLTQADDGQQALGAVSALPE